ncbi:hypothetical protein N7509_010322 [Penicillium cosmopolitanum]|uniref:DNA-binding protein RAP1 n=1 Tax=Penicillium cosmopolitanum TaxID=1131564 RepID=A0A9W9VR22_9EURO|nr:uncharacterized protein N7509_010322 [Penicillium cosmopolitanum]KAJ5387781.1 hypothetical protein N7509_010322 [Penicillium cosmopolitanum]
MSVSSAHQVNIFQGQRFWLSREVPQRSRFKDLITKHGGVVVLMEKDADVMLVDHIKKNIPTGCHSYKYVEESIRKGQVADLDAHRAGSSRPRAMGASNIPKQGTKSVYTLEDDQLLYDFLYPFEQEENAPIHGNKIYQLLERRFPKHPWQSSRSRYLKKLRGNPRPGGGVPRTDLLRSEPHAEPRDEAPRSATPPRRATPTIPTTAPAQTVPSIQQKPIPPQPTSSISHIDKQSKPKRKHSPAHEAPSAPQASPSKKRAVAESRHRDNPRQDSPRQPLEPITRPPALISHTPVSEQQGGPSIQEVSQSLDSAENLNREEEEGAMLFMELPFLPSPTEPADESFDEEDDGGGSESGDNNLIDWVETQVSRGFDDAVIDDALCCTSLNCKLAGKILNILAAGNPIPNDIPGVWTSKDDEDLQGSNGREVERVLKKHGEHSLSERWNYLSEARERDMI